MYIPRRRQDYKGEQEWYRSQGYVCVGVEHARLSGIYIPYQMWRPTRGRNPAAGAKAYCLAATRISAGWYELIGGLPV